MLIGINLIIFEIINFLNLTLKIKINNCGINALIEVR